MRKIFAVLALTAASAAVVPLHAAAPLHPVHMPPPPKPATAPLHPAPVVAPAPVAEVCLNPKKDYDADYLSGRAVLIKANEGRKPRPRLKADTNCIGIDGSVKIKLDSQGKCVMAGDALKLRRNGDFGWQTCQITQITPVTDAK
jgi:hypothetical protein